MKSRFVQLTQKLHSTFGIAQLDRWEKAINHLELPDPPPVTEHWMELDKRRLARTYPLEHQFLQILLARKLTKQIELKKLLDPTVVSFQKGRKVGEIFEHLTTFLSQYKAKTPKKNWGLHVFRWDISSYSDSIPIQNDAPLWQILKFAGLNPQEVRLIQNEFQRPDSDRGVPFGSPLNPPILNLYLSDFDRAILAQFPGTFYRRFGDDCLLISPQPLETKAVWDFNLANLGPLGLKIKPEKQKNFIWSQIHTQRVEYLGRSISFRGLHFLTRKKVQEFLADWGQFCRRMEANPNTHLSQAIEVFLTPNLRLENGLTSPKWIEIFEWVDDSSAVLDLSHLIRFRLPKMKKTLHTYWREARFSR